MGVEVRMAMAMAMGRRRTRRKSIEAGCMVRLLILAENEVGMKIIIFI